MSNNCAVRAFQLRDEVQSATLPVAVLYPTHAAERTQSFGPFSLDVASGAPVEGTGLPLVLISHGNGGTPWAYRDLAKHLATHGFVVALPEHTGNCRSDNRLENTAANLENRPRHLSLVIDALFADALLGDRLKPDSVGVIGHSIGSYTALAVAGGKPWAEPRETEDRQPRPIPVRRDPRVRALVLLTPAVFWFPPGGLKEVNLPILIRSGSQDQITPVAHAETIVHAVADASLVEHEVISGAGHFSILSPFPAFLSHPDFPPSQDPEGFDRLAYQPRLFADIERFLAGNL